MRNCIKSGFLIGTTCVLVLMTACGKEKANSTVDEQTNEANQVETRSEYKGEQMSNASVTNSVVQTQMATKAATMDVCGIYIHNENTNKRELVKDTYESKWVKGKDIMCFEVFNSTDAVLNGSNIFKYLWEPIWFAPGDAKNYRIGYEVQFAIDGGNKKIDQMILMPEDTERYKDYIEFYLYDDYHQTPGVWYSHVEQDAYNNETLLTSIKFTAGQKVSEISGDITLTAFIYDPSTKCFDANNRYVGNLSATITVKNKK